tara:strand:- start:134 stop:1231 length:1098 start_codon:yes stop_codon:yes gene_type:complete
MVTMRDRGRQDLATILNFLRPREGGLRSEFLRNRSNVPTGGTGVVTSGGATIPNVTATAPFGTDFVNTQPRGSDMDISVRRDLEARKPGGFSVPAALRTDAAYTGVEPEEEEERFSFGQGLRNVFNSPTAFGNIAAGISLLEGGSIVDAVAIKDAFTGTADDDDNELPASYGKVKEDYRLVTSEDGTITAEIVPGTETDTKAKQQIETDRNAIQRQRQLTDSYLRDIKFLRDNVKVVGAAARIVPQTGTKQAVEDAIGRLQNKQFISNLQALKAGGASLGQVTENEGQRLQDTVVSLNLNSSAFFAEVDALERWVIENENNVIGKLESSIRTLQSNLAPSSKAAVATTQGQDTKSIDDELAEYLK